jgi:hypothetical protein
MFHGDFGNGALDEALDRPLGEQKIKKLPQRPMILGDKWDF